MFFLLLIADVVFAFSTLGWDGDWPHWGPIIAIGIAGLIGFVGGLASIYIARLVLLLCALAFCTFIVVAIAALVQAQWLNFWFAVGTIAASFIAGGPVNMLINALVRQSIETKLGVGLDELR